MKHFVLLTFTLLAINACDTKQIKNTETQQPTTTETAKEQEQALTFDEPNFDFGIITQGDIVQHTFPFTNTSDKVVKITKANASCGCTVPEWPAEAIAPGEKGNIDVEFNSTGKSGKQNKTIRVYTDAATEPAKVTLIGIVEAPKQ